MDMNTKESALKILKTLTTTLFAAAVIAGCGNGDSANVEAAADAAKGQKVLLDADSPEMKKQAPDEYQARFETNKGAFVIDVERKLAPHGADRFYNLVRHGFYDGQKFFRVMPNFIVQWGMHGDPKITAIWQNATILDDPVAISNERGTVTYAKPGRGSNNRTVQLFINLVDNGETGARLDRQRFSPFGRVSEGMKVVDAITTEYGQSPNQPMIAQGGNAYLNENYPNLDTILSAKIVD